MNLPVCEGVGGGGGCMSACTCMYVVYVSAYTCMSMSACTCVCVRVHMHVCVHVCECCCHRYACTGLVQCKFFCLFLRWRWIYGPPANPQAQNNHLQFHNDSLCSKYTRSIIIDFFHHTHLASVIQSRPTWPKRESSSSCSV